MHKPPVNAYQSAVEDFKRKFLRQILTAHGGNRTRTARALGLQRTYLLRLIRELEVDVPPARRSRIVGLEPAKVTRLPCAIVSRSSTSQ